MSTLVLNGRSSGKLTISHNFTALSDLCAATGSAMVTFTATDTCGNAASVSASFTIVDTTAPVFTSIPVDTTVECDGMGNTAQLSAWLANVAANDACGNVVISHNFTALSDLCAATGSAMVTFTATDACGNSASVSASFTIVDTTAPEIVCPQTPMVVIIPGSAKGYVAKNGEFDYAGITDNCGKVTAKHYLAHTNLASLNGFEFPLGNTQVVWTVTDECGNISECSFMVTVYAPSLKVTKTANPKTFSNVGEIITYTITLTNDGNATVTNVVVKDPLTGLNTTINTLLPGATSTFTEFYTIRYEDLLAGKVLNSAIALGFDPEGNEVSGIANETINAVLDNLQITVKNQNNVLCFGDSTGSAEIEVRGGLYPYQVVWHTDPVQTGLTATKLPAGTYVVIVTDALGKTTQLSVVITQPQAPLNTTFSVTNVLCRGNNTGAVRVEVYGGTLPYGFLWNNGANTRNIADLTAGNYSVLIKDANGCELRIEAEITQPPALFVSNISTSGVLCKVDQEGSIQFNTGGGVAPYTYLWNTGATTPGLANIAGGDYSVAITDANGCQLTHHFFVPYEVADCEFRIPQGLSPDGDGINDVWEINGLVRYPNNVVRIYNRWGTLVFEAGPYQNNWDGRPNRGLGSGNSNGVLPTGTYFYVIELQPGIKPVTGYFYLVSN